MKQRIEYLYDAIHILADKSDAAGNVDFLKKNNSELKARLRASEREEVRMKEDLDDCEGRIKGLKKEISILKDRIGYRSPSLGAGKVGKAEQDRDNSRAMKSRDREYEPGLEHGQGSTNAIQEKGQPLSMREVKERVDQMVEYDSQLSQQIDLLEKLREEGRRVIEETQESGSDFPLQWGPKITQNVQVPPPLAGRNEKTIKAQNQSKRARGR